jgi:hypothetical protein
MKVDKHKLNNARWAACNTWWEPTDTDSSGVPTMEKATEVADRAIAGYFNIDWEEWKRNYWNDEQ